MIISPLYQIAFLPVERTGSQTIETLLRAKDPDQYRTGNHRHGAADIPEGYQFLISKRNPLDRLASFFAKSKTLTYMGYGDHFTTFEEFFNFIEAHAGLPFLDDPDAPLFAPHNKVVAGDLLVQFPIPLTYYLQGMPSPDIVVNFETYIADVQALPFVDETDTIPQIDGNDWDINDFAFDGMLERATRYDLGS